MGTDQQALTMIDPASSWFKMVDLPLVDRLKPIQSMVKSHPLLKNLCQKHWLHGAIGQKILVE
jgi:hypothetical protein